LNKPKFDVTSVVYGFSKPLYSTWVFYKPDNLLIDCGEGAATRLGNCGFGIERILLTHGHIDHISGLSSLIWSRAAGRGDKEKPLDIYYPLGDSYIEETIAWLKKTQSRLPFRLGWHPIKEGYKEVISMKGERYFETFATQHIKGKLTLGYKIVEKRRKLKEEYRTLMPPEIGALVKSGTEVSEFYNGTLITFGGDGIPLNPDKVAGTEILFHEATLADASERKQMVHSTIEEAIKVADKVNPKSLVLYHLSSRYTLPDLEKATRKVLNKGNDYDVWLLYKEKLVRVR
jgi:ribonuclease Z